jgi:ABC-type sugar transport system ATPase subunit
VKAKECILEMRGITKRFPGVLAVDQVDLALQKGEVLALVGENGAGKSTLIKILAGAYKADAGEIQINGQQLQSYSPSEAISYGVGVIYQELNYVNDISIAENIFLGCLPVKGLLRKIDYVRLKRESLQFQEKVGIRHDPFEEVAKLSVAEKQLLEIARAFAKNVQVLVFDEPTSALNEKEIANLFALIKSITADGKSVIYISHKMDEIFTIADSIQVMRDGKSVALLNAAETSKEEVVKYMVGREIKDMYPISQRAIGEKILEVTNLNTDKARQVQLDVKQGEIVGLFGLMGAGRSNIVKAIYGAIPKASGEIKIAGKPVTIAAPEDAIRYGIAYIPSERKTEGLILNHSVKDNMTIAALQQIRKSVLLDLKKEKTLVDEWVQKLRIKTPSIHKEVVELSGGNQQKVVLAKYLLQHPKVMIMNEPTKGIDVGAKVEIYKLMEELCAKGLGILLISSEMPEIMAIADRILVISNGQVTGECRQAEYNQEQLMHYAIGG